MITSLRAFLVAFLVGVGALSAVSAPMLAQVKTPADSSRCDSVVAAAKVDSVPIGIFLSVGRLDGLLEPERAGTIVADIAAAFAPPRPFRLSVFSGPVRMRMFVPVTTDTAPDLRAPTVTGAYRFVAEKNGAVRSIMTSRGSLVTNFDSAAKTAIHAGGLVAGALSPPDDDDSMRVEVRFSTDSTVGSIRILSAYFPRMPVVDAVPRRTNPPAIFPEDEKADSTAAGDVVLRFVVDGTGTPVLGTAEAVRASSISFLRAAVTALPTQRFAPATIHGCTVSQRVDYPFSFVLPASDDDGGRSRERSIRH
jgi:hypothetical protein